MRELRTFELDETGQPVNWRAREGQHIMARHSRLWLTVEGHHADIWLEPGATFALPAGERVWLSGEVPGASFTLAQTHAPHSWRRMVVSLRGGWRRLVGRRPDRSGQCLQP